MQSLFIETYRFMEQVTIEVEGLTISLLNIFVFMGISTLLIVMYKKIRG